MSKWAEELARWAIPEEILAAAPRSPWIHPVELFRDTGGPPPDTPSRRRALEALPEGGVVLDVGCGGGRAALALAPPAGTVLGVDHQQGMLEAFAAAARARGVRHGELLGDWPDAADQAPDADVVVCHHVVYNVPDLPAFALALGTHARHRVVLELPRRHPLAAMAPLWRYFWGLERPEGPTAEDALETVRQTGADARLELWSAAREPAPEAPTPRQVEFMRVRLCLTADRDTEVAEAMADLPGGPRQLATIWWDTPQG